MGTPLRGDQPGSRQHHAGTGAGAGAGADSGAERGLLPVQEGLGQRWVRWECCQLINLGGDSPGLC